MKKNLILFLLLLTGSTGMIQAQQATEKTRQTKTEANSQDPLHASALDALTHGHFVLQAEEVIFTNGEKTEADSTINFVAMKGSIGVVQLTNFVNGTRCGITMEGRIGQLNIEKDRKGNTICTFHIDSPVRTMALRVTLSKKKNEATAEIGSCKHVKGFVFNGHLLYGVDAMIRIGDPS